MNNFWIKRLKAAIVLLALAGLTACGGGGGDVKSPADANAPAANQIASLTTQNNTLTLDASQAALVEVGTDSSGAANMTIGAGASAALSKIESGQPVLIPAGQDQRFPLGLAAIADSVTQNAQGQKQVTLKPATFSDVYKQSSVKQEPISLSADNFIGAIAPLAVRGTGASVAPQQVGLLQKHVTALNGALTLMPAKLGPIGGLMAGVAGEPNAGEIELKKEIPLKDLFNKKDVAERLKPHGEKSDGPKLAINIKLSDLILTNKHEFKEAAGVPYDLRSMNLKLDGKLKGEIKLAGEAEASIGPFDDAWEDVAKQNLLITTLYGLDSKDKEGKFPLAGLVFSIQCPQGCETVTSNMKTPINMAKTAGVVVWLYMNAKGEISFNGEIGARANANFTLGMSKPEGGQLGPVAQLSRASGISSSDNFLELPFLKGEAKVQATLGTSVDVDFFFGGLRLADAAMFYGKQGTISATGEWAYVLPDLGQSWHEKGDICIQKSGGSGAILSAKAKFSRSENATALAWQAPTDEQIATSGDHDVFGVPVWHTDISESVCFPRPVAQSVTVERTKEVTAESTKEVWRWTVAGANLPDDLTLEVSTPDVCSTRINASILAVDNGRKATFTCEPTGQVKDFSYQLKSEKASNLDATAIVGEWHAATAANQVSNTTPGVLEQIWLWLVDASSTITKVVWNFGAGIAEKTANVAKGVSDKISQVFNSTGPKTVTATYLDANGNIVGKKSLTINVVCPAGQTESKGQCVQAIPAVPTIAGAVRQSNGQVLVTGTAGKAVNVRITWPDGATGTTQADAGSGAWRFVSTVTSYTVGQTVSVQAYGDGGSSSAVTQVIVDMPVLTQIISAGGAHSLVLKSDGTLWATGGNYNGQLGAGDRSDRKQFTKVLSGVTAVSAGWDHSLALKSDGSLWAAGRNDYGQLGTVDLSDRQQFTQVLIGVSAISATGGSYDGYSLALKHDGTLWATGRNDHGQLGTGDTTDRHQFTQVMSGVAAISADGSHSLALKSDGTLWATGYNNSAALGTGDISDRQQFTQVLSGVFAIAAGANHSLALKSDGTLWATGGNYNGQFGTGGTVGSMQFIQVLSDVSAISASSDYSLVLKSDGTLWATGWNGLGQLGTGDTTNRRQFTQVLSGVSAISAGGFHSLALKSDGTLWTVGSNSNGQLGTSDTTNSNQFVKVLDGVGAPALISNAFDDDFGASSLDAGNWNVRGVASCGGIQFENGVVKFNGGSYADTMGKRHFQGSNIVLEANFAGLGQNRDTIVALVDVATDETIQIGDTNYQGRGFYAYGAGAYALASWGNFPSTQSYLAYRATFAGNTLKIERGSSLDALTQVQSLTLGRSIAGRSYYLRIGTGAGDCYYSPGWFDWIRVRTTP